MSQRVAKVAADTDALASQYNALLQAGDLFPHESDTPNMRVYVDKGVFFIGPTMVTFVGGQTGLMTAPVSNPRIDAITINTSGTVNVTTGTEAASPSAPSLPGGEMPICYVYHRVGSASIKDTDDAANSYIYDDIRPFNSLGSGDVTAATALAMLLPSSF